MSKLINFQNMQIVVEKALRNNGFGGTKTINGNSVNLDEGWKDSILLSNTIYENPQNTQRLRDAIAQSIVEGLSSYNVTGDITRGNTISTNQIVQTGTNQIFLNGDLTSKGASRVGDGTEINNTTDPVFINVYGAMITALYSLDLTGAFKTIIDNQYGGLPSPSQIVISGVSTSGSSTVKIGD